MFNKIKNFIARGRRGYSDEDVWDFHSYLARIIPPVVRKLQKGCGCPSEFFDKDNKNNECQKWHDILEEIAQGFESMEKIGNYAYQKWEKQENGGHKLETDQEALNNLHNKSQAALNLLAKHFFALWD